MNCKVKLIYCLKKDCVLVEHHNSITGVNFMITSTKIYVPSVTLTINNNIKLLEKLG